MKEFINLFDFDPKYYLIIMSITIYIFYTYTFEHIALILGHLFIRFLELLLFLKTVEFFFMIPDFFRSRK